MIRHIVAFSFKDGFSAEENRAHAEKVKYELENLKNLIPEIVEMKVIIDLASTSNRDVMLSSLFHTKEDLAAYQVHPEHKRVGALIHTVMTDRVCLDFNE